MSKEFVAYVGKADKSIDRNTQVKITLGASLAFLSVSQSTGPGINITDGNVIADIEYNCSVFTAVIVKTPPANILVDKDNPNRFVFMAIMASYIQSVEMEIYLDTDDNSMFCIPCLKGMGDTVLTEDLIKNTTIPLEGYGLGLTGNGHDLRRGVGRYETVRLVGMPMPIETRLSLLRIAGMHSKYPNQGSTLGGGDTYIEQGDSVPAEYISLGSTATLGSKVPAYRILKTGINQITPVFVGNVDLDDVLIRMPL